MAKEPRITHQTLKVLDILMSRGLEQMSGADIARETRLQSGTLYPLLLRLEEAGWLTSAWEDGDPRQLGRPRRRFYRVTALGQRRAQEEATAYQAMMGRLAWN